ncbi:MAG: sugar ABC transporter permease [Clostridia bacterium]|nr:sugar ABC transporter permease [Clostridia bacterium]
MSANNPTAIDLNKPKSVWERMAERWQLYALLALPLIYVLVFAYGPMGGLVIAFKDYKYKLGIWGSPWVGMENFVRFFTSYKFWGIVRNTLALSVYTLVAGFPVTIFFALCINAFPGAKYAKVVQTVTYIPHFISTVIMVGLIQQLLNNRIGIWGIAWSFITGQPMGSAPAVLTSGPAFAHMYVWTGIWQGTGYSAVIYIAALAGVDPSLHEAAIIDGANRAQRCWHIDIPTILPTAVIMLIMQIGHLMSVGYEKTYLLQNTQNLAYSEIISTYVYKVGLTGTSDFSYSTAIGLFNSIINFILLLTVNKISNKVSGSGLF